MAAHALPFLKVAGLEPRDQMTCAIANCSNQFAAEDGIAFDAETNGEPRAFLCCSPRCYLNAVAVACMGTA